MLPYTSVARARHSSVFPTPVGPAKSRQATGRPGSRMPLVPRRTASATALTARDWPTTWLDSRLSRFSIRSRSTAVSLPTGMPVRADTTQAMSEAVTARGRRPSAGRSIRSWTRSRSSAAFSNRRSRTAS